MAASSQRAGSLSRMGRLPTQTFRSGRNHESSEPISRAETTSSSTSIGLAAWDSHGAAVRRSRPSWQDDVDKHPTTFQIVRQDSGYESGPSAPRNSTSSRRRRNPSKSSSSPSRSDQAQHRPSLQRSGTGTTSTRTPGRSSLNINRPSFLTPQQQSNLERKNSYFQFPAPELENLEQDDDQPPRPSVDLAPVILKVNTANLNPESNLSADSSPPKHRAWPNSPVSPRTIPPPTTTHYWTSDRTRQLEYAAIDAARKGVRGWIMRHVVPDYLVPRHHRRAGTFEDDGGSVRRYRIDLEIESPEESVPPSPVGEKLTGFRARGAKKSWWSKLKGCNA